MKLRRTKICHFGPPCTEFMYTAYYINIRFFAIYGIALANCQPQTLR